MNMLKNNVRIRGRRQLAKNADLRPQGAVSLQKMRPPRVFWEHFGSRKRYARSYARNFKMAFGPPTMLKFTTRTYSFKNLAVGSLVFGAQKLGLIRPIFLKKFVRALLFVA
jgi:hypothetical protein